jgi:hypothetical protein
MEVAVIILLGKETRLAIDSALHNVLRDFSVLMRGRRGMAVQN